MAEESFLKPAEIIETWDVRPRDIIADFGCGSGHFAIPLGKRVGNSGKIYALDIRPQALEATRAFAKLFGLTNIEPVRTDLEAEQGSGLSRHSVNKVLITNILFQGERPSSVIEEAYRITKPGGSVAVIEWDPEKAKSRSPILPHMIEKKTLQQLFEKAGFALTKEIYAGSHHYGFLYYKQ